MNGIIYNINQGQSLENLRDDQVESLILKKESSLTYFSSINVNSEEFRFSCTSEKRKSRKITFVRSGLSTTWEVVKAFFIQLFAPGYADNRYGVNPLPSALIGAFVGSHHKLNVEEMKRAEEGIAFAYARCSQIIIHLSDDCTFLEAEPILDSQWVVGARLPGKFIHDNCILI